MKKNLLSAGVAGVALLCGAPKLDAQTLEPTGVYLFAEKDGEELSMSIYDPAPGSQTRLDGRNKPTVIFLFGGGFKEGTRDNAFYLPWYRKLTENGYRVVSIDYRLGLKDVTKLGIFQNRLLEDAMQLAVEDLFSATAFLLDNAESLGIEPDNIVISGSSAGAMTSLQADWELCNRAPAARVLPVDFHYAGVMAFSGAVFSRSGFPSYMRAPAPTLFFHGTADRLVPYKQISFLRIHLAGSDKLSAHFRKKGYNYSIYRFLGNTHEIASSMELNFDREIEFLENNVMRGEKRIVDLTIDDPSIERPEWANWSTKDVYR